MAAINGNFAVTGKQVTNAATRKQVTGSSASVPCYAVVIQALPTNAGAVTLGDVTVVASTGVGAMCVLQPGQTQTISFERALFDAASIYFDVATSTDGITGYVVTA